MSTTLYTHPDGHEITVGDGVLVDSTEKPDHAAERAGAALAHDLLSEMLALRGRSQVYAYRAVCDKLQSLCELGDVAAGGFATVITYVLVTGIANLKKLEVA